LIYPRLLDLLVHHKFNKTHRRNTIIEDLLVHHKFNKHIGGTH
jgi:hypothetical protein